MQAITPDCPSVTQSFYLKECQTHALLSGMERDSYGVIGMEATCQSTAQFGSMECAAGLGVTSIIGFPLALPQPCTPLHRLRTREGRELSQRSLPRTTQLVLGKLVCFLEPPPAPSPGAWAQRGCQGDAGQVTLPTLPSASLFLLAHLSLWSKLALAVF